EDGIRDRNVTGVQTCALPIFLSGLDTIKICTAYNYQGEKIDHLPYSIEEEYIQPIYKQFKGWTEDITDVKHEKDLPLALMDYIAFIEKELNVPVKVISVGPDRTQTIIR